MKKLSYTKLNRAIEAKCKDCIYDDIEPGTRRKQVENCPAKTCPLWPVRPGPVGKHPSEWREKEEK